MDDEEERRWMTTRTGEGRKSLHRLVRRGEERRDTTMNT